MRGTVSVALTSFDDAAKAREVAEQLVEEGLVACAQLDGSPHHSVYRWKGTVESTVEWRLVLKFPAGDVGAVQARLLELHPYETPEFVVLAASASPEYARWVDESCS